MDSNLYDDDALAALAQLERRGCPAAPIAFYGSSSFRLWRSLAADLSCLRAVNLGFGGGTCASALHYFDRLLAPLNPDKVVLYFGENDISNDGLTGELAFAAYRQLLQRIRTDLPFAKVFALSAKQSPAKWLFSDEVDAFNVLLDRHCQDSGQAQYVDVTSVLLGSNGRPLFRCYESDLIHLNAPGYGAWAAVLTAVPGLFD
jgi:lysophospholipase L1-like esterase